MMKPQEALEEGRKILAPILEPHGFVWEPGSAAKGSGGDFAEAAFVRGNRRLEMWFRFALSAGFRIGGQIYTNEDFVWAVSGEENRNRYPGFGENPLDGFNDLAYDLQNLSKVFVVGTDTEVTAIISKTANRPRAKGLNGL